MASVKVKVRIKPGFDAEVEMTDIEKVLFRYETGLITEDEAGRELIHLNRRIYEPRTQDRIKQLVSHLL